MPAGIGQTVYATTNINARYSPGGKFYKTRKKGYEIKIEKREHADGRWWIRGSKFWYAEAYVTTKAPAKPKVTHVKTPVPGWKATTPYKKKPNNDTYWQTKGYHTGTDWAAPNGARCVAVRGGTVHRLKDYMLGNVALLFADNGQTYWYCHLSAYSTKNGAKVKTGTTIGRVGATGRGANGPHLHLERRSGHTWSWKGADKDPLWGWA